MAQGGCPSKIIKLMNLFSTILNRHITSIYEEDSYTLLKLRHAFIFFLILRPQSNLWRKI